MSVLNGFYGKTWSDPQLFLLSKQLQSPLRTIRQLQDARSYTLKNTKKSHRTLL